jgi:hypothetical protein
MILTDVVTATNMEPLYYEFIPLFIHTWKKLFPEVNIHIIVIADTLIDELKPYKNFIKLFAPIKDIKTAFIAQNIRLFYPALINAKGGILITDMDIIPMNRSYYSDSIKNYDNDKFVIYRPLDCVGKDEIAMCYNIAHQNIWQEMFDISSMEDIITVLKDLYDQNEYDDTHGGDGWNIDQLYLYEKVQEWEKKTNSIIYLTDEQTKFKRLCRTRPNLDKQCIFNIKNHKYTDYHLLRPYQEYKKYNDLIFKLL